jgi:hypothetical protein
MLRVNPLPEWPSRDDQLRPSADLHAAWLELIALVYECDREDAPVQLKTPTMGLIYPRELTHFQLGLLYGRINAMYWALGGTCDRLRPGDPLV